MIEVKSAVKTEKRDRDIGRNRILLCIGDMSWHLTRDEAEELQESLKKVLEETDIPDSD